MKDSDAEAKAAWDDRMQAVRHSRKAEDDHLVSYLDRVAAADLPWTLLSVRNRELLTKECGWSQDDYIRRMTETAERALVA